MIIFNQCVLTLKVYYFGKEGILDRHNRFLTAQYYENDIEWNLNSLVIVVFNVEIWLDVKIWTGSIHIGVHGILLFELINFNRFRLNSS